MKYGRKKPITSTEISPEREREVEDSRRTKVNTGKNKRGWGRGGWGEKGFLGGGSEGKVLLKD